MKLHEFIAEEKYHCKTDPNGKKVTIKGFCSELKADGKELPARREMVIYECGLGIVKNNIDYFRALYTR